MRKLSIALVRQRYAQDGGAERFVAAALEGLRARGLRVTLFARSWKGEGGYDTVTCNPYFIGRLWRDWSFARSVCRMLKKRTFDLIQSHERIACCDVYRAGDGVHREWLKQLARVRGTTGRLLLMVSPYHIYVKWAERRLFLQPRLRAVICNSRMVRDEIKCHFGVPDEKLCVIYNGVDTDVFHPGLDLWRRETRAHFGIPQDAMLFLFVGSGFERKGVPALLEAIAALPATVHLLVVGRDRRLEFYQARAADLGIKPRVHFAGSQPDVRPAYGAADALVLPTLYDPGANVVLEAMASGLPVVTSNSNGLAEIVEEGVTGYICDSLDVAGLTDALLALCQCPDREALRVAARRKAEEFSLNKMTEALQRLYERILSIPTQRS